ncbi:hypothetical protein LCER1_G002221, partial [Lachnellula cervina]
LLCSISRIPAIISTTSTSDNASRSISVKMLPLDSSVFSKNGPNSSLPSPAVVRATQKTRHLSRSMTVRFEDLKLVVKYGSQITIAEAQCLWATRRLLPDQVPVPEVYGWCEDGGEIYIYIWSVSKAKRWRTNGSRFRTREDRRL